MKKVYALMMLLLCLGLKSYGAAVVTVTQQTTVVAGTLCTGTTKAILFDFEVSRTSGAGTIYGFNFTTAGTYVAGDVVRFQVWANSSNNFATATTVAADITTGLAPASHHVALTTTQPINSAGNGGNVNNFFWVTVDIAAGAADGHTISVNGFTATNATVTNSTSTTNTTNDILAGATANNLTSTGTAAAGGAQVIHTQVAAITPSTASICVNSSIQLSDATSSAVWACTGLAGTSVSGTGLVTSGATAGAATVTYTLGGIAACAASRTVTVLGGPNPTIGGVTSVCVGSTGSVTNSSGGGTWSLTSAPAGTTINAVSGLITAGATAGTAVVNYATGCGADATTTVAIAPLPTISGSTTACVGQQLTLTGTPGGGSWLSGTGTVATIIAGTGVLTGVGTGNTIITYTQGGCSNTRTETVNAAPSAVTVTPSSPTICNNGSSTSLTASGGTVSATTPVASGTISVTVPDANAAGVTTPLTVALPAGAVITGIVVTWNIAMTYDADLRINVQAPNGNILNLYNGFLSTSNTNFTNTRISSAGGLAFSASNAPFNNIYAADAANGVGPTNFLSNVTTFPGLYSIPNGTWLLAAKDVAGGDVASITNWTLTFTYTIPGAVTWSPITALFTDGTLATAYSGGATATVTAAPTATQVYTASSTVNGCSSTGTSTVNVTPVPTADFSYVSSPYCSAGGTAAITLAPGATAQSFSASGLVMNGTTGAVTLGSSPSGTFIVTNSVTIAPCPMVTSTASITINPAVSITTQPVGFATTPSTNATFSVVAANATGYQWQVSTDGGTNYGPVSNDATYSGANTSTLTVAVDGTMGMNGYLYNCVISGVAPCGTTTSNAGTLTVSNVAISTQPASQSFCSTASPTISFVDNTDGSYTYQWQENQGSSWNNINDGPVGGINYTGTNSASLAITGLTTANSGWQYQCIINGAVPTNAATITIYTPVSITTNPGNQTMCSGAGTATFTAAATGSNVAYHWQQSIDGGSNWTDLTNGLFAGVTYAGTVGTNLTITNAVSSMNGYLYRCNVTGGSPCPAVPTTPGTLTVNTPVAVTTNPVNVSAAQSGTYQMSVVATGTAPTYQWQISTNGGGTYANISNGAQYTGTGTSILTITNPAATLNGDLYRCTVTGTSPCSFVNSTGATLTVASYCIPLYGEGTLSTTDGYMNQVLITGFGGSTLNDAISTANGLTASGYDNRTSVTPVVLRQGDTYTGTLTYSITQAEYENQIWIDFNNNGVFEASEAVTPPIGTPAVSSASISFNNLLIPLTAPAGLHRMRIRNTEDFYTGLSVAMDPCNISDPTVSSAFDEYYYGATADYIVNIQALPACTGDPAPGPTTADNTNVCFGTPAHLGLTNASASTINYQWQVSADDGSGNPGTFTNIAGATGNTYAASTAGNFFYQCVTTCPATNNPIVSDPIEIFTIGQVTTYPYMESFDGPTAPALPCGWTVLDANGDGATWRNAANTFTSGGTSPNQATYAENCTNNADDWLFTPPLTLHAGFTYRLTFNYGSEFEDESMVVKWGTSNTAAGMTSTLFSNNSFETDDALGASGNLEFTPPADGTYFVGFHATSPACFEDIFLDDVQIQEFNPCTGTPTPGGTNPTVGGTLCGGTSQTLTLDNTAESGLTYQWQSAPDVSGAPGTFTNIGAATNPTYSFTATGNTTIWYQCVVICSATTLTATSTPLQQISTSGAITTFPYHENFDGMQGYDLVPWNNVGGIMPCGWTVLDLGDPWDGFESAWVVQDNAEEFLGLSGISGSNVLGVTDNFGAATENDWAITPPITMIAGRTYRLNFNYGLGDFFTGDAGKMSVFVGTSPTGPALTTALTPTFNNVTVATDVMTASGNRDFTPTVSGNYYVGFHCTTGAAAQDFNTMSVDDVDIQELVPCAGQPSPGNTLSSAGANLCFGTSTTLSTQTGFAGVTYQWQSAPDAGGVPGTFTNIAAATASSLTSNALTTGWYQCNVTCLVSGLTGASAPIFITVTGAITSFPYFEGFEGLTGYPDANFSGVGQLVPCGWTIIDAADPFDGFGDGAWGTINVGDDFLDLTGYSGANALAIEGAFSATQSDWAITPPIAMTAGRTYRLNFKYGEGFSGSTDKISVLYGITNTAAAMTQSVSPTFSTAVNVTSTAMIASGNRDIIPAVSGNYFIGFKSTGTTNGSGVLAIDDVSIQELIPCAAAPAPGNTTSTLGSSVCFGNNVTVMGMQFNFTGVTYQWKSAPDAGGVPGTFTPIATATNITYTATVTAATWYECDVTCSVGGLTGTSAPYEVLYNSAVVSTYPYLETFDEVTPPAIPCGWTINNANNDNSTWVTAGAAVAGSSGPNVLQYSYETTCTNAANDWAFTPPMFMTAGNTYQLTFNYGSEFNFEIEQMEVKYGTSNTVAAMTNNVTPAFNNTNIETGAMVGSGVLTITPAVTGTYNIGFHAKTASCESQLYLDDVSVLEFVNCSGQPVAGTTLSTAATACTGFTSTLSTQNSFNGVTYQWKSAPDAGGTPGSFTPVAGATNATYTATITASTWYECDVTCTASGLTGTSTPSEVSLIPCLIQPAGTGSATATICSNANYYDSGGPNGDYQANETNVYVFTPGTPGGKVSITFNNFFAEENPYDYIKFYNGNSIAATLISQTYGNDATNVNLGTITSTAANGALTVQFHSDVTGQYAGWSAVVSEIVSASPITTQPANASACVGDPSAPAVSVVAGGTNTYQWYSNTSSSNTGGTLIGGATASSYAFPVGAAGTFYYYCVVTACNGSSFPSTTATITINAAPTADFSYAAPLYCAGTGTATITLNSGATAGFFTGTGIAANGTTGAIDLTSVAAGTYTVTNLVTLAGCATVSANASITVTGAPVITVPPAGQSTTPSGAATFSVTATGPALTYQWQENDNVNGWLNITAGPNVNGATYGDPTQSSITITSVQSGMDQYQYRCVVTGSCGFTNTDPAVLSVSAIAITTQPVNQTVCGTAGATASFSIVASDDGSNTYQWLENQGAGWNPVSDITVGGVTYSGSTSTTLTLTNVTNANSTWQYRCVIDGSVNSNTVTLTVPLPVVISAQSSNVSVCSTGGTANFTVSATGTSLTYQWVKSSDGTNYSNVANGSSGGVTTVGATTAAMSITNPSVAMDGLTYKCVVTGAAACTPGATTPVVLSVNSMVAITVQPASTTVCSGIQGTFAVTASGTTPGYQWQVSIAGAGGPWNPVTNGGAYSGATAGTLSVTPTSTMNAYQYRCVVSGASPCGSVTSSAAVLTVSSVGAVTVTPNSTTICEYTSQLLFPNSTVSPTGSDTVGFGTLTSGATLYPNPLSGANGGVKHQMMFKPAELTAQGLIAGQTITSIGFQLNTTAAHALANYTIRLGTTAATTLNAGFVTGMTTCYTGTYTPPATLPGNGNWVTFPLTTPFTWNGTSQLIVETEFNGGGTGTGSGTQTNNTATGYNSVRYGTDNNVSNGITGFDALTPASYSSYNTSTNRPNVKFGAQTGTYTWAPTTGLYTDAAATTPYTGGNTALVYASPPVPGSTTVYTVSVTSQATCTGSATASVTATQGSVPGTASSDQIICTGSTPTDLTLVNDTGVIVKWQKATNLAFTTGVTDIPGTAGLTTLPAATMGTLTTTTYYRAVVQNASCPAANSNIVTITVNPASVAGTVAATQTICQGSTPVNLTSTGNTGSILKWQSASDAAFTLNVADINVTASPLNGTTIGPLSATTYFRVVVQSGVCPSVNSATPVAVNVDPTSVGGTISSDQSVCSGSSPASDLVLSGNTGNVLKWQSSTDPAFVSPAPTNITDATNTLTAAAIGALTTTTYFRAVVQSGTCSQTFSANATITVNQPVIITTQPSGLAIQPGTDATFTVAATGTGLGYQWQESIDGGANWNNIANGSTNAFGATYTGSTAASMTISSISTTDMNQYQYQCIVNGASPCASVTSVAVLLQVSNISITTQPVSTVVCTSAPDAATYTVVAANVMIGYQWQENQGTTWADISDATVGSLTYSGTGSATLTVTGVSTANNAYQYRCVLDGSVTTNAGGLTVYDSVGISVQPTAQTLCSNAGVATFAVTAAGAGLVYQWMQSPDGTNWTNVANGTVGTVVTAGSGTPTMTINHPTPAMSLTQYKCVITGIAPCAAAVTNPVVLTVNTILAFTTQPNSANICASGNGTFTVALSGTVASYQWQVSTTGGGAGSYSNVANGGVYSGSSTASLVVTNPTAVMSGYKYQCIVTGTAPCVNATSSAATLTVTTMPLPVITPAAPIICLNSSQQLTAAIADLLAGFGVTYGGGGTASANSLTTLNSANAYPAPFSTGRRQQRNEMLVLASELTAQGFGAGSKFDAITMHVNSGTATIVNPNFAIRMGLTNVTSFSNVAASLAMIDPTWTTVFAGALSVTGAGDITQTFTTPFTWDGTSNLLIDMALSTVAAAVGPGVVMPSSSTSFNSCQVAQTSTSGNTLAQIQAATVPQGAAYVYAKRPDFKLSGTYPSVTWAATTGLYNTTGTSSPYVGASTNTVFATPTATSTYTVTVANVNGCTNSAPVTVTVNPTSVGGTASADQSICAGTAPNDLTLTGSTGTVVKWQKATNLAFTTGVADIPATAGLTTLPGATIGNLSAATYFRAVVASGVCSQDFSSVVTISMNPQPVATTIAPATASICAGSNAVITFSSTTANTGNTVNFTVNGTPASLVLDGAGSAQLTLTNVVATTTVAMVNVSSPVGCSTTATGSSVISMTTPGMWTGVTSTDWNDATNWSCGVPTPTVQANIPSGTPNAPTIGAGTTVASDDLFVASGVTLTLGDATSSLDVHGNVTDLGVISGGNLIMGGSTAQTITGTGKITNMEVSNTNGVNAVTIVPGSNVNIIGTVTLTNGTLTTNGGLTLFSDENGTGRVATITGGSISGTVVQQQYIPGGRRAMRMLAHPYNIPISLDQFQSDDIDITGGYNATAAANGGFTITQTNNPSAFWYNTLTGNSESANVDSGYDAGWTPFASVQPTATGNDLWYPGQAIRILIRGAKGIGLWGAPYVPAPVTLNMSEHINQGPVTVTLHKGAGSDYNMVGNPYPSPVEIGTIVNNALTSNNVTGSMFWVWNTNQQGAGAYVGMPIDGTAYNLESNGGFMVEADHEGAVLNFVETDKSAVGDVPLFRTTNVNDFVTLNLYDSTGGMWDKLFLRFDDQAQAAKDAKDAFKPQNSGLDFYSLTTDGKRLNLDARPYVSGQVIPLGLVTTVQQKLVMKIGDYNVPAGAQLYLHDKYLQQYMELHQGSVYNFEITTDTATQGDNRFELSLQGNPTGVATVQTGEGLHVSVTPNPADEMANVSYSSTNKEQTSIRLVNVSGIEVFKQDLGITNKGTVTLPLEKMPAGIYLIELTSGSKTVTQRLVKE